MKIPPLNRYNLEYIVGLLEIITIHQAKTKTNARELALLFAPCLIRNSGSIYDIKHLPQCIQFVEYLIGNFEVSFKGITEERIEIQENTEKRDKLFKAYFIEEKIETNNHPARSVSARPRSRSISRPGENDNITSQSLSSIGRRSRSSTVAPRISRVVGVSENSTTWLPIQSPPPSFMHSAPVHSTICTKCKKEILSNPLLVKEKHWHPQCFSCDNCSRQLDTSKYFDKDGKSFCDKCIRIVGLNCKKCSKPISGKYTKALGNYYHTEHFTCYYCSKPLQSGFYETCGQVFCSTCTPRLTTK